MSEEVKLPPLPDPRMIRPKHWSEQQIKAYTPAEVQTYARQAVLEERERCAKLCDAVYAEEQGEPVCYGFAKECADAIRGVS